MTAVLQDVWAALGGPDDLPASVKVSGTGGLASSFAVTDFGAACTASAALALAEFIELRTGRRPPVSVDRRLASLWFAKSIRPVGWKMPPQWDPVAGNYAARDGWIRLHTNARHHRDAALSVLGCPADAASVASKVSAWSAADLQEAVVAAGGVAAKMLTRAEWQAHEQGKAVSREPLVAWTMQDGDPLRSFGTDARPLSGLRVLDLTRILAGPVATRFLAGFGADVLRIDPPDWDEPAVLPEVTPGKRCARLDLRTREGRNVFTQLLVQADVIVHGYRADALEKQGFGVDVRRQLNPNLIDVALNAYGWSGPWANRRGYDTIVQMSAGLAAGEMARAGTGKPEALPVQALDYGTGHMMAAAVLRALTEAARSGKRATARFSLARTAEELARRSGSDEAPLAPETDADAAVALEPTYWGPAHRLMPPFTVGEIAFAWDRAAGPLGADQPRFEKDL